MPDAGPSHLPLESLRREYGAGGLRRADLAATWEQQLDRWMGEALAAHLPEPNAVTFATASAQGRPSARTVLLKAYDERGLVVFTNYTSRKGREAAENPFGSLVLAWLPLERQVVVAGSLERVSPADTARYFHSRPRGAQLGAWASHQSRPVASREELERLREQVEQRYAGQPVPVPPFWGGLRLVPDTVEFWQGRADRMHDRLQFRRTGTGWVIERLAP